MKRGALPAALLLALASRAGWTAAEEGFTPAYAALVARYAHGDRVAALREAGTWTDAALKQEWRGMLALKSKARCPDCPERDLWRDTPLPAAVMLHTDRDEIDRAEGRRGPHLAVADAWAALLLDDPPRRDFTRRWYHAMIARAFVESGSEEAAAWAQKALHAFPDAPELLLAQAAVEEEVGSIPVLPPADQRTAAFNTRLQGLAYRAANERLDKLKHALSLLDKVLAAQPDSAEARLRRGRVAWRLQRPREARAAFEWVLAHGQGRPALYLAHLFLGRVEEDDGRAREAEASYRAAVAVVPDSQAANLALSFVLFRLGDEAGARRTTEVALAGAGRREGDPFWVYPWGPGARLQTLLEGLRREVST
jgi:tetratricopeptide (TPR) repeat protein